MKINEYYLDDSFIEFKDNRKTVVLKDKKGGNVSYRGDNINRFELITYKVENGILNNQSNLKCDYGLYTVSSDSIRFVELKGSDLDHAIKQILFSIDGIIDKKSISIDKVYGRIVLS